LRFSRIYRKSAKIDADILALLRFTFLEKYDIILSEGEKECRKRFYSIKAIRFYRFSYSHPKHIYIRKNGMEG